MNIRKLASAIALRDKKKKELTIGSIRKAIGYLSDILSELDPVDFINTVNGLYANGKKRARKKRR